MLLFHTIPAWVPLMLSFHNYPVWVPLMLLFHTIPCLSTSHAIISHFTHLSTPHAIISHWIPFEYPSYYYFTLYPIWVPLMLLFHILPIWVPLMLIISHYILFDLSTRPAIISHCNLVFRQSNFMPELEGDNLTCKRQSECRGVSSWLLGSLVQLSTSCSRYQNLFPVAHPGTLVSPPGGRELVPFPDPCLLSLWAVWSMMPS